MTPVIISKEHVKKEIVGELVTLISRVCRNDIINKVKNTSAKFQ